MWKMGSLSGISTIGRDHFNALFEHLPFVVAVEVVGHEEAASEEVFAHDFRFVGGESPLANLDRVEPGPVEGVVSVFEQDRLFGGADVETGEARDGFGEVAIGAGVVLRPEGQALAEIAIEAAAVTVVGAGREHQAREGPLGFFLIVRREFEIEVFDPRVLMERALKSVEG